MDLELLAAYMEWADRRTAGSVLDLPAEVWERPLPSSYGSLAGTVEHIFAAEWTWLERVSGRSPAAVGPEGGARERSRLMSLWEPVWEGWREVASRRPAAEVVRYRTSQGTPYETSIGEILLHVSHHSAAYRGQVVALLRTLGLQPASGDMIAFLRGRRP